MSNPQVICEPTCTGIGIRNATDAFTLLEAVRTGVFPLRRHRLSQSERDNLSPGQVFVWTESSESSGLERWTDGRKWSASRTRDVFLIYEEREEPSIDESVEKAAQRINTYFSSNTPSGSGDLFGIFAFPKDRPPKLDGLMKQTFSAWVNDPTTGQRVKWHLSAYLSRQGPGSLPSVSEHPHLSRIRVPNGMYECCTGPRKNRRGSRPQPPGSTAATVAAAHIPTANTTVGPGYRRGSSVASSRTVVESEPSPIAGGQYSPYHHEQQIPGSTGAIRVVTKPEVNHCDPWDQQHAQYFNDAYSSTNVAMRRSPSSLVSTPVSMTSTLSPPTSGATTPRTMSSSSLGGVTIADRDYDREREWERRRFLGPRSTGGVEDAAVGGGGACCYYVPDSPTDSAASSTPVTPPPTMLSTNAGAYSYPHSRPQTRDHRSTSISSIGSPNMNGNGAVPPLFNKGSDVGLNNKLSMWYRSSPPPPSMGYHPTQPQTQEPHPYKQRLSSNSSIAFGVTVGGGGGGVMPHYSLRSDADSKAVAAFKPF